MTRVGLRNWSMGSCEAIQQIPPHHSVWCILVTMDCFQRTKGVHCTFKGTFYTAYLEKSKIVGAQYIIYHPPSPHNPPLLPACLPGVWGVRNHLCQHPRHLHQQSVFSISQCFLYKETITSQTLPYIHLVVKPAGIWMFGGRLNVLELVNISWHSGHLKEH